MQNLKISLITFSVVAATLCSSAALAQGPTDERGNGPVNGAEHRSVTATFVQNLLDAADKEQGGIGEQVRVVAQEQNGSKDKVADAIDKIQSRGKFKTFLIGTDYKNIGELRSEMVKTGNRIDWLNRLLDKTTDETSKTTLKEQIQALELEQQKIEGFIADRESKFSLLGWFVRLFY